MDLLHLAILDRIILVRRLRRSIHVIPIRNQVHLDTPHKLGPLNQFPTEEHANQDWDLDIVGDKVDHFEMRTEAAPTLDKDKNDIQPDGDDRTDRVRPVLEREEMFQALFADGCSEAKRCNADANPGQLVGDADNARWQSLVFNSTGMG